ncbi:MAG: c-type cytochrome [Verrucomicrobiales bacterium]|nr:c-type cytochrome [Verrucomicrobiales bacterium]
MRAFPAIAFLAACYCLSGQLRAEEPESRFVTLNNLPMGSVENPFLLRTYFPDPGLGREVLANHSLGFRARKYSPGKGDVKGFVDPIPGIPAAIGVNFGSGLSICWDTTECRLLYAWSGGFLDMTNYWGKPESGRRKGFGYIPELVGEIFYLARGSHPLAIFDSYTESLTPEFKGYRLENGVPEFSYSLGDATIHVKIEPGEKPLSFRKSYRIEGTGEVDYHETGYSFSKSKIENGTFSVVVEGKPIAAQGSSDEPSFSTDKPNRDWGESLYTTLGCIACHSLDGSRGHGPSFAGLYGAERPITGSDRKVKADDSYLVESITNPMAKVVEGFPPGYMPPYPLEKNQIQSLIQFIQTLGNE